MTTKRLFVSLWPLWLASLAACDGLLEVVDPDLVTPEQVQGERGAELYWAGALGEFARAFSSGTGGQAVYGGLLADEFYLVGTFNTRIQVDQRAVLDVNNGTLLTEYRQLHRGRVATANAIDLLEEFPDPNSRISEMWSLNGYTYLLFAEHYCSGVPFGQAPNDTDPIFGDRVPTSAMLETALSRFAAADAANSGSADQAHLASMGSARAYLNQGDLAAAAAAAASVPSDWRYLVRSKTGGTSNQRNALFELNHSQRRWSLSDVEGGNGVPFRSSADPRVPWADAGPTAADGSSTLYHQLKYDSWESDVTLASGIEARLIEAEADLAASGTDWLMTLNTLRTDNGIAGDLTDPGTSDGRVDLLFDERARWLFGTAHRLGDLRRLIRQYGRAEADVFPSGAFPGGGVYGVDVNLPIPREESANPLLSDVTGPLCLDRDA